MKAGNNAPRIAGLERSDDGSRPFWSVMIPTYNPSEKYLSAALKSVLEQDEGADQMQIEVLDDGSPAGAPSRMVEEVAGGRIEVIAEPRNLGLAGIWNRCIERARGKWVHILHQDDLVYPGFYVAMREAIGKNPEIGAAFCRHSFCDEEGRWRATSEVESETVDVLPNFVEALVSKPRVQCASIVVQRSVYESLGGFRPELRHALDWEMWLRIADVFPIAYEPRVLAAWRQHDGATTSRQMRSGENIRDIAKAIGIWEKELRNHDGHRLGALARRRFAGEALDCARRFLDQNDPEACRHQLSAAVACNPSVEISLSALRILLKSFAKGASFGPR